jgi:aspartyl-tRNA(Asn)/glutamyl-tRNA(Gln) amidotransferase subunit A
LIPTVAITAPPITFEQDQDYRHLNAMILRNTSVVNFLDGCAATLPIASTGAPVGLMVVGGHGADRRLLALARGIEAALA